MEVEARVNVRAIKGKFEQLKEDPPAPPTPLHPALPIPRPRTASLVKESPRSEDAKKSGARLPLSSGSGRHDEGDEANRTRAFTVTGKASMPGFFSNTTPPTSASSSRKHSSYFRDHMEKMSSPSSSSSSPPQVPLQDRQNQEPDEVITTSPSDGKSITLKKLPVFHSGDSKMGSVGRKSDNQANEKTTGELQGLRGKFFTHIRSRSHGNFNLRREGSVERESRGRDKSSSGHKENLFHTDWLTPKRKQRSTDNLLCTQDSNGSSTFERKQKIVANMVHHMKNKDKPDLPKKFSFSSKIEKEFKNMKEKSINSENRSRTSHVGTQGESGGQGKRAALSRTDSGLRVSKGGKKSVHNNSPDTFTLPNAIAKAVADAALKKSGPLGVETSEEHLVAPPSRPPRRRSGSSAGGTLHRKGMAPSPPDLISVSPASHTHLTNGGGHGEKYCLAGGGDLSPDMNGHDCHVNISSSSQNENAHMFMDCPGLYVSCESLISSNSAEKSHETSPVMLSRELEPSDVDCQTSPTDRGNIHDYDLQGDENSANDDAEEGQGLPAGPPPKKPPRTFAYDIYKNLKTLDDQSERSEITKTIKSEPEKSSVIPIYAVPMKKNKGNNFNPKPPMRSKSDLSTKDIVKPSVAPKPPHIVAKAKRASLVDTPSSEEKEVEGEREREKGEPDQTSEFQRQAHLRYSLRRPKPPSPPHPPPNCEVDPTSDLHSPNSTHHATLNHSHHSTDNHFSHHENNSFHQSPNSPDKCKEYRNIQHRGSRSQTLRKRPHSNSFLLSPDRHHHEDTPPVGTPSSSPGGDEQPMSLGYCSVTAPLSDTPLHSKRSMSDETLYKGSRRGDEPVYATPIFGTNSDSSDQSGHRELHYMEGGGGAGRDGKGRRASKDKVIAGTDGGIDGGKGRSGIISAWKREFRQSCRQVQKKIKNTVIR